MSIPKETIPKPPNKIKSIFSVLRVMIVAILIFMAIIAGTVGVLYFTNTQAKNIINKQVKAYKTRQEKKKQEDAKGVSDARIPELAKYYLQMNEDDIVDKLLDIKKEDKKSYEKLLSSMMIINPEKTANLNKIIQKKESKKDIIKQEYDDMLLSKNEDNKKRASSYTSLGVKGSIDAIQKELQTNMDYTKVASALENMQPKLVAEILYYINPMYLEGIKNRLNKDFLKLLENETQKYSEFLRKNASLGEIYGKTEEKIAAKKLEDKKNFTDEDLAVIFLNMEYLDAAKILNEFTDVSRVQDILTQIKNIEDYQMNFEGSYSSVVANSVKVLKKYNEDVDILKRAYEKMPAEDLAGVIDKLVSSNPVYKIYKIDNIRKFSINEKQMTVDTLKKMKPVLVGQVISQLKNENKLEKAAYLSRELGIPEP